MEVTMRFWVRTGSPASKACAQPVELFLAQPCSCWSVDLSPAAANTAVVVAHSTYGKVLGIDLVDSHVSGIDLFPLS